MWNNETAQVAPRTVLRHARCMARSARDEFAPGLYHVNIRGNDGMAIVRDDVDRSEWVRRFATIAVRMEWLVQSWTLLPNHYHALLRTVRPNLGEGMQWLNGGYARAFNQRHGRRNHLFGERFWSEKVETDSHYLEVTRYIPLNAVKCELCERPEDYAWCSYRETLGLVPRSSFLRDEEMLELFGGGLETRARYARFVDVLLPNAIGRGLKAAAMAVPAVPVTVTGTWV
jgi:REP element-mobilizing transposase RayT